MAGASAEVELPVPVEQAWALLSDTRRMVEIDPLLESYEPETATITAGTCNRVTARLGHLAAPRAARIVRRSRERFMTRLRALTMER